MKTAAGGDKFLWGGGGEGVPQPQGSDTTAIKKHYALKLSNDRSPHKMH